MHEENVSAKEQLKTVQEKLIKARAVRSNRSWLSKKYLIVLLQFIKSQDKLFKDEQAKLAGSTPVGSSIFCHLRIIF